MLKEEFRGYKRVYIENKSSSFSFLPQFSFSETTTVLRVVCNPTNTVLKTNGSKSYVDLYFIFLMH